MKLPDDWSLKTLSALVDAKRPISYGVVQTGDPVADGVPCVRVVDLASGKPDRDAMITTSQKISSSYSRTVLAEGDVIIALRGEIGRATLVPKALEGANLTRGVALLACAPKKMDPRFMFQSLACQHVRREIMHGVNETGLQEIPITNLRQVRLPVPPLPEQRKIADILTTWDEALTQLDALIEAQERRKKALMQQLLTGKKRLAGATGVVKFVRASELFSNRAERNTYGLPILSVTQDQGVVLRSTLERRISHDEQTNGSYKVVRKGDFVISLRSFQGGLEYSEIDGAVSPAYHIIRPCQKLDLAFFKHYFKSADFVGRLATAVIGIRDGKQISFTDFGFIKLPFPPIEDQKRIGVLLDTADQQLTLLRTQRSALDQQKRGLMQRLLTGKLRVKP